ncbi:MAG: homoserine kinase, partial [Thaumarchaeota archaeon]|nr:homoserine kinase [Nitrososphaerota archaeon]
MDQIWVEAPASSANLGPGFDVFALALDDPKDKVHLSLKKASGSKPSVRITDVKGLQVPFSEGENGAG